MSVIEIPETGNSGNFVYGLDEGHSTDPNVIVLKIKVVEGARLAKKDIFGLSDPYCSIKLFANNDRNRVVASLRTTVKKKTLNPKWNSQFFLRVNKTNHRLLFEIFDENRVTRDDFLGEVEMPLDNVDPLTSTIEPKYYILHRRSTKSRVRGHIMLMVAEQNDDDGLQARHIARDLCRLADSGLSSAPEVLPQEPGWETVSQASIEDEVRHHRESIISGGQPSEPPLPEGWEERQDANGRIFYVNHVSRTTTWVRPNRNTPVPQQEMDSPFREIANAPSFNIRRHISAESSTAGDDLTEDLLPPGWEARPALHYNGQTLYIDHNTHTTTWTRPSAITILPSSSSLSTAPPISSGTDAPATQEEAPANVRLHADVPSQGEMPLPAGWAMQLAQNGRVFFIDHNRRITSWIDPRVNDQPEAQDLGPLPAGWEERVNSDGRVFFIDHDTQSTQWEDPRIQVAAQKKAEAVPYSRDYKRKYDFIRSRLKRPENVPNKYEIHIRRNHILEDSFRFVFTQCQKVDLLKTKLWIVFDGEIGLDYGGVAREWFYALSKEIFNPYYGLFEYSATDNYTLQINPNSGMCNEEHLRYFRFIGRVAGMACYHNKLLDAFFIRPFYKMMLGKRINLKDMESVDSEYHNGLVWVLENDPEDLDLTFQVEEEVFGEVIPRDLKPNGENIPVTNANKREYIDLFIKWRFVDRVSQQMNAFMAGFHDVIPQTLIQVFDERELEYLLCGLGEIDVDDWRKNTNYRSGYHDKHVVIQWFWKAVVTFDKEMKARLLQFVTGTSRVPMNGFAELYGSNGPQKFAIERWGNSNQLPRAHTCFNRLDLPQYASYHELREKIRLAIENTEGFEGVD